MSLNDTPLGKHTDYPQEYAPELLYPISRRDGRQQLGIADQPLPFFGEDIWNAYELSWLDRRGKPVVAQATFRVPAQSPSIIESKSLKLYLNSLNQTRLESREELHQRLQQDLSRVAGAPVNVIINDVAAGSLVELPGECLDALDIEATDYQVNPYYLSITDKVVEEQLHSHLLRSLCPVTGQPDWASIQIAYKGPAIDHISLLQYLISYRQHQGFHEQCVEQIFMDIHHRCRPQSLMVKARYLRRGGLDINPCRSSDDRFFTNGRLLRQ